MADHRSEIDLPDSLYGMDDFALDMRLISSHRADRVWHRVNPELWVASCNPWAVLKSVGQSELEELGATTHSAPRCVLSSTIAAGATATRSGFLSRRR